jgi:hypothetical protein
MLGIAFEFHVHDLLKREFLDYDIIEQPKLANGTIPDFIVESEDELIVVDAKDKQRLTLTDIDQMTDYLQELDADFGIIYVASDTDIPESVEYYAARNAIEIEYTRWRSRV